ncbi:citrate synthase [Oryzihumus sp.]|uniref:citrate synthase n=1 Tax=Oryzihumus sp. TaxID=1968903 RepID=UPI002ED9F4CF
MATPDPRDQLTSRQVADRLGVRLETVYAYASRGLLTSTRVPGGRGSVFDRAEVDALRDRGRRDRPAASPSWRGPVVDTDTTLIEDGHLYFRGVDAVDLAAALPFEHAASWLWTGGIDATLFQAPEAPLRAATRAVRSLPGAADLVGRLRVAVAAAGAVDPRRYDTRGPAAIGTAGGLVTLMVDSLPRLGEAPDAGSPLARRLWAALSPQPPTAHLLRCLDAALVLLMDHGLAVSTVAARTAASVRAHPYAVVATGLSAMEGPLHGAASTLAHGTLRDVLETGAAAVVADHLRTDRPVPGFGHQLYPAGDPRASALLALLADERRAKEVTAAVRDLTTEVGDHPNVDLALAALAVTADMPRTAGEVVFAIARSAGWVAHALEEYDETPLRFRGHGRYRGPHPPQPVPRA